jgi:hypothetical protein
MWDARLDFMGATATAFAVIGLISTTFLLTALTRELFHQHAHPLQFKQTSLTPQTVNWLLGAALVSAGVICSILL